MVFVCLTFYLTVRLETYSEVYFRHVRVEIQLFNGPYMQTLHVIMCRCDRKTFSCHPVGPALLHFTIEIFNIECVLLVLLSVLNVKQRMDLNKDVLINILCSAHDISHVYNGPK